MSKKSHLEACKKFNDDVGGKHLFGRDYPLTPKDVWPKTFDIWMESSTAFGIYHPAQKVATYRASSFKNAVAIYRSEHPNLVEERDGEYWLHGCRLFSSEELANNKST